MDTTTVKLELCRIRLQEFVWSVLKLDKIKSLLKFGDEENKCKVADNFRHVLQSLRFLITSSYVERFKTGKTYSGDLKKICVPGTNCYSCPGAKGSCPIGSLQAVIRSSNFKFSYYIVGFLFFIGVLMERLVRRWLCLPGLI